MYNELTTAAIKNGKREYSERLKFRGSFTYYYKFDRVRFVYKSTSQNSNYVNSVKEVVRRCGHVWPDNAYRETVLRINNCRSD